ncbi:hypothetical protein EXIGLDRAFT_776898 [Exidia glandulosa HHB12029]|uniref:Uncharacterized protein n=1 Tax=Exidia glandulosa HHB12029 TaxID=1314781 RepID=A0A165DA28_EXIGL|nr:hypothetical protein EXIGLDRAFT_776898 [Exidia glandulosa HHB12029]
MPQSSKKDVLTTRLQYLAVALKVAREGTDAVPIARQILGSAAHCVDLAITLRRGDVAVKTLAESAAMFATQINEVTKVRERMVDGALLTCLERLDSIFTDVREFVMETANAQRLAKIMRYLFVIPERVAELQSKLNFEVQVFLVATAVEANVRIAESALYDGEVCPILN